MRLEVPRNMLPSFFHLALKNEMVPKQKGGGRSFVTETIVDIGSGSQGWNMTTQRYEFRSGPLSNSQKPSEFMCN